MPFTGPLSALIAAGVYTEAFLEWHQPLVMDLFTLLTLTAICVYALKSRAQRSRIALLGRHLGNYQIEKLMETLTEGYSRALGESDLERQTQIWSLLNSSETALNEQFKRFSSEFSRLGELETRVSKLMVAIPYAERFFPRASFDMRKALAIHAKGIDQAANSDLAQTPKNRAFTMLSELFLMQYSCHWFCRSRAVASARLMTRHQSTYAQLLAALAPETRKAYIAMVGP